MRSTFTAMTMTAIAILIAVPMRTFAQTPDTVWVPPSPVGNINEFIMGDTTSTGARVNPNRVYELYRDSLYFFTGTMNVDFPLTMIAGPGNGPLPVIEPAILSNNSRPYYFINLLGGGLTLKQLYLFGVAPDQVPVRPGKTVIVLGDSMNIRVDSCVFDGWTYAAFYDQSGKWNSFWITNNIFRNMQDYTSYYYGDTFISFTNIPTDTVYVVNNTMFCDEGYVLAALDYNNYLVFNHNTVFLNGAHLLSISKLTNAQITNNIFFGNDAMGSIAIVGLTSLGSTGATYGVSEADRRIILDNNAYYWPQNLQDFWNSINDTSTSSADSIFAPAWMTSFAQEMFEDTTFLAINTTYTIDSIFAYGTTVTEDTTVDTSTFRAADTSFVADTTFAVDTTTGTDTVIIAHSTTITNTIKTTKWYPYLEDKGNFEADPRFSSSILSVVSNLDQYVYLSRTKGLGSYLWWYNPTGSVYPPTQPVPENLAYSNTTLQTAGTDGFALGDLNWFPSQKAQWLLTDVKTTPTQVPTKFSLSNNYPNPFNPSTDIKVTLAHPGVIALDVYDVLGQLVKVVDHGYKPVGSYLYNLNMNDFASGVYFYRLQEGNNFITKKMVLLK